MKNFGFGCMRLPMKDNEVDYEEFSKMIKVFFDNGFTYFDTAHGYIKGKSEIALRECLTSKYPRESYQLTNKLSDFCFNSNEDIIPFFNKQLEICGVTYFDYYLMHCQTSNNYQKYKDCKAYETALQLKKEGKIKHFGISFHDKADFLRKILTEYPEIEAVQIQFNYLDYENPSVEGRKCYEVCREFNKDILIMEPVKGGSLINLPSKAQEVFDKLNNGSNASYALRFTGSFEGVKMILSGMSNLEQMEDNVSFMKDFKPLSDEEFKAVFEVCDIIKNQNLIACTACRYCVDGCVKNIPIPEVFASVNQKKQYNDWNSNFYYNISTNNKGKASDCIMCGKCEKACPQFLPIRKLLKEASEIFDKK